MSYRGLLEPYRLLLARRSPAPQYQGRDEKPGDGSEERTPELIDGGGSSVEPRREGVAKSPSRHTTSHRTEDGRDDGPAQRNVAKQEPASRWSGDAPDDGTEVTSEGQELEVGRANESFGDEYRKREPHYPGEAAEDGARQGEAKRDCENAGRSTHNGKDSRRRRAPPCCR